jgi:hypothetical protein
MLFILNRGAHKKQRRRSEIIISLKSANLSHFFSQKKLKVGRWTEKEDEENNIDIESFEIGYISRIIQMSCSFVS